MRLQTKVFGIVLLVTLFALALGYNLIDTKLHQKDLAEAKHNAYVQARLIRSGILGIMVGTGDPAAITRAILDMQKNIPFEFRMIRSEHVIRQHGVKRQEVARSQAEKEVLRTGKPTEIVDGSHQIKLIFPFITDERCATCHLDMNDKPVAPGMVNGAAVLTFDMSEREAASAAIRNDILLSAAGVTLLFALLFLFLTNRVVTRPVKEVAEAIDALSEERFDISLPPSGTREIDMMAERVKETASALKEKMRKRKKKLAAMKERNAEVAALLRQSGLDVTQEGLDTQIVRRLSMVMDEAERTSLIHRGFSYLTQSGATFVMPPDPAAIQPVSSFLANLIDGAAGPDHVRQVELSLEEALANAIIHGCLDIASPTNEEDLANIDHLVQERMTLPPYNQRKVTITSAVDSHRARFVIRDDGLGFDWRNRLNAEKNSGDDDSLFGRGLMIIKSLATEFSYNKTGNELIFSFDLTPKNRDNA